MEQPVLSKWEELWRGLSGLLIVHRADLHRKEAGGGSGEAEHVMMRPGEGAGQPI